MSALSPYSGSLATRPVRQLPSTKRQGTAASDAPARMMGGRSQPLSAPSAPMAVAPNRRDNILNARSDGTFQAKRDLYNQQGLATGHSMDAAGNITAPPVATKPGGKLIPGSSPGSAVWQPNAPAPTGAGTSSPPPSAPSGTTPGWTPVPGGEVNSKGQVRATAPASAFTAPPATAPRHTTGAANPTGLPAVDALLPQVSTPPVTRNLVAEEKNRQGDFTSMAPGSRNLVAEEQQRQPSPVTNTVTNNVTSPVTMPSPSQGPAATALAAFNTAHPNVLTGAAGVAQTDALAATRRTQVAAAVNATQGPAAAARRKGVSPTTTTPAGVPAPSPQFNGSQQDRYNLAMQAASQPVPAVNTPAPAIANNGQPPSATGNGSPPAPGYFAQKAAANPGGIISKGIEAAGMLKNSLSIGAQNIKTAAQAVAPVAVAPLRRLQQGVQSGVKATATGLQTQAERNPSGFLSRLMGTKTAVNPSKVALIR